MISRTYLIRQFISLYAQEISSSILKFNSVADWRVGWWTGYWINWMDEWVDECTESSHGVRALMWVALPVGWLQLLRRHTEAWMGEQPRRGACTCMHSNTRWLGEHTDSGRMDGAYPFSCLCVCVYSRGRINGGSGGLSSDAEARVRGKTGVWEYGLHFFFPQIPWCFMTIKEQIPDLSMTVLDDFLCH